MHITAPIRVKILETNSIRVNDPSDGRVGDPIDEGRTAESSTIKRINRLVVGNINGMDWNTFVQSVYQKNAPQIIKGNLSGSRISDFADL